MFTCLYCDYNSAIGDDSLKLASKCSNEQTCTSLDQECTIKDLCRKRNIRRQQDFLHVIRGRPFDFDQGMDDFMGLRKNFFSPKPLVVECFSLTYKAILWQVFSYKTFSCSKSDFRIFFLKSPIPPPSPPPRSGLKRPLYVTRDMSSEREFRCSLHASVSLWE